MTLKNLSTTELQRELARRQKNASKLESKRNKLLSQLAEVESELAALGSSVGSRSTSGASAGRGTGKRRRARNEMSLPDAIAGSMELRAVVSPREAAELVKANGYKTNSKSFNMMVSNALSKDKRFKRLGRGQYERIA